MTQAPKNSSTEELRAALSYTRTYDEKRKKNTPRLTSMPERRRQRKTVADIFVPEKHTSIGALRFTMQFIDVLAVISMITLVIWNGYIGANDKGTIAPVMAALFGSLMFTSVLFFNGMYQLVFGSHLL